MIEPQKLAALRVWLASQGVGVAQSFTIDDAADFYYFDTRRALRGFYVQVVVPRTQQWQEQVQVDEVWDFSSDIARPAAAEAPTRTIGIPHFGMVVHEL